MATRDDVPARSGGVRGRLRACGRGRQHGGRVGAPVRADVRDGGVRPAGSQGVTGACRGRRLGVAGDGPGLRGAVGRSGSGGGRHDRRGSRGGPEAGGGLACRLLRRHPGAPPPGWPDRGGSCPARIRPCDEAAAADGRRPHRGAGEGAHVGQGDRPPRGGRGRLGRQRSGGSRGAPPREPRSPTGWPPGCASGCPGWGTCTSARSAPSWEPMSGRACSRSWSPRADCSAPVHSGGR